MALEVSVQRALAFKRIRAQVAQKELLTGMNPQVALEVRLVLEPGGTHVALVRLGAVVAPHVLEERAVLRKLLAARAALQPRRLGVVQTVARRAVLVVEGQGAVVAAKGAEAFRLPRGRVRERLRWVLVRRWLGRGGRERGKR